MSYSTIVVKHKTVPRGAGFDWIGQIMPPKKNIISSMRHQVCVLAHVARFRPGAQLLCVHATFPSQVAQSAPKEFRWGVATVLAFVDLLLGDLMPSTNVSLVNKWMVSAGGWMNGWMDAPWNPPEMCKFNHFDQLLGHRNFRRKNEDASAWDLSSLIVCHLEGMSFWPFCCRGLGWIGLGPLASDRIHTDTININACIG
jgi:hypothetical protein